MAALWVCERENARFVCVCEREIARACVRAREWERDTDTYTHPHTRLTHTHSHPHPHTHFQRTYTWQLCVTILRSFAKIRILPRPWQCRATAEPRVNIVLKKKLFPFSLRPHAWVVQGLKASYISSSRSYGLILWRATAEKHVKSVLKLLPLSLRPHAFVV